MTERTYEDGFTHGEHVAWDERHDRPARFRPTGYLTDYQRGWWDAQFPRNPAWMTNRNERREATA